MRRFSSTPLLLAAAVCTLLAGCAAYQFVTPGANWQTLIGQLQYASPKRSIIGETVVTRSGESDFQLDFLAGPGLPILKLRKSGERGRAEAAFARVSWQGNADHPPGPLKSWFALQDVFAELAKSRGSSASVALHSQPPGFWDAKAVIADGKPADVQVNFPHSKERFHFHFGR